MPVETGAEANVARGSTPIPDSTASEPESSEGDDLPRRLSEKGWNGAMIKSERRFPFNRCVCRGCYPCHAILPHRLQPCCMLQHLNAFGNLHHVTVLLSPQPDLLCCFAGAKHTLGITGEDDLQLQILWPDAFSTWVDKSELHSRPHTHLSLIQFYESKTRPK